MDLENLLSALRDSLTVFGRMTPRRQYVAVISAGSEGHTPIPRCRPRSRKRP
jgi:hypothetical protein